MLENTTPKAPGPVLNLMGMPCSLAPLIAARGGVGELPGIEVDARWLAQTLGTQLKRLEDRAGWAHRQAETLADMFARPREERDTYALEAAVDVLREYLLQLANLSHDTTTDALAMVASAGLLSPGTPGLSLRAVPAREAAND